MAASDRFREHMSEASAVDPATEVVVTEACRIIDRLAELDGIITGKTEWIRLMHFRVSNGDQQEVTVTIDGVLAEARQQSAALDRLFARLGLGKADMSGRKGGVVDPLDQIAARRAARGSASTRTGRSAV